MTNEQKLEALVLLLNALRIALRRGRGLCPECEMSVNMGGLHGISQIFPGEDCHLGYLLGKLGSHVDD